MTHTVVTTYASQAIFLRAVGARFATAWNGRITWAEHTGLIAIDTTDQFEQARLALERRSPQELAAFTLTLSHVPNGIGSYVGATRGRSASPLGCVAEAREAYCPWTAVNLDAVVNLS